MEVESPRLEQRVVISRSEYPLTQLVALDPVPVLREDIGQQRLALPQQVAVVEPVRPEDPGLGVVAGDAILRDAPADQFHRFHGAGVQGARAFAPQITQ